MTGPCKQRSEVLISDALFISRYLVATPASATSSTMALSINLVTSAEKNFTNLCFLLTRGITHVSGILLRLRSSTSYAIPLHQKVEFQVPQPGASCPINRYPSRAHTTTDVFRALPSYACITCDRPCYRIDIYA